MAKRKKSGKQNDPAKVIILLTALANLIAAIVNLINRLLSG